MMSARFEKWFTNAFSVKVDNTYMRLLSEKPQGVSNRYGPILWDLESVIAETEDRCLIEKGICLIGTSDSISHILMRAKDGKVFIVDSRDHTIVDATFRNTDSMVSLLNLE